MLITRRAATTICTSTALLFTASAEAHLAEPMKEELDWWLLWQPDPLTALLLALAGILYWRGSRIISGRMLANRGGFVRRQYYFWLGWSALALALVTPIDPLGELLFSLHMIQHELMMLIAAPLLVLSRPSSALLVGAGRKAARPVAVAARKSGLSRGRQILLGPGGAWVIHAVGLWGWHIPYLFNAGLANTWIHTAQHFSFLSIALMFWYSLLHIQKSDSIIGMVYLFTTALHASLLGALITFSPRVWYSPYLDTAPAFGISALEDQQLGGLIMWMPAGVVFIAGALIFLARLLPNTGGDDATQEIGND